MTQDVALPSDYDTGLEDFDPAEAGLPRIQIKHEDGVFLDKQTNEEFPNMYGVMLGLIKQRVMWGEDIENDSVPQCKSNDGEVGYPNVTGPSHSLFPWTEARGLDADTLPRDESGRITIKCETCPFTKWGARNSKGKSEPPRCSERYTMPVHFSTKEGGELDHAGIISFQRSGITPMKAFIGAFSRSKMPLFSALFSLALQTNKRGTVTYSVPVIKRVGSVPEEQWSEYATEYRAVREALRRPPISEDGAALKARASDNSWGNGAKPARSEPVAATVVEERPLVGAAIVDAASTPVTSSSIPVDDSDDLPF